MCTGENHAETPDVVTAVREQGHTYEEAIPEDAGRYEHLDGELLLLSAPSTVDKWSVPYCKRFCTHAMTNTSS
jgi:hypothetical protein